MPEVQLPGIPGCVIERTKMKPEIEKLIRPVKCHFCGDRMYYSDDERYEPEVYVTVQGESSFYAHIRCWNQKIEGGGK